MTDPDFQDEVLAELAHLRGQIFELMTVHESMMRRMHRQHGLRIRLLDELLANQQRRDAKLDKMIDHVLSDDDDWWKSGEVPPWN